MDTEGGIVASTLPAEHNESACSGRSIATLVLAFMIATFVISVCMGWIFVLLTLAGITFIIFIIVLLIVNVYSIMTSRKTLKDDVPEEDQQRPESLSASGNLTSSETNPPPDYVTVKPLEYGWHTE